MVANKAPLETSDLSQEAFDLFDALNMQIPQDIIDRAKEIGVSERFADMTAWGSIWKLEKVEIIQKAFDKLIRRTII